MSVRYDGAGNVTPIGVRRQQPGRVTVLALGGPWHGQRITMPETEHVLIAPVPEPATVASIGFGHLNTVTYVVVKMGWHSSRRVLKLLVPEKWTQAEAEHALVDWIESGGA